MNRCWHTYEPGLPRTSVLSSPMNVLESKEIDQRAQDRGTPVWGGPNLIASEDALSYYVTEKIKFAFHGPPHTGRTRRKR